MNREDLAYLEACLRIRVPESYLRIMLNYSPLNPDAEWELVNDPVQLLNENNELRRDGFFGMPWPEHYLWIGGDGAGNAYFLDLQRKESPVFFADHERRQYHQEEADLERWCKRRGLIVDDH